MDAEDTQQDPLRDAREAALRRIGEMRQRSLGAERARRARTCARCWCVGTARRRAAAFGERARSDPADARRGRSRARAGGGRGRARPPAGRGARPGGDGSPPRVERVERDLLAERMARVEDLEVLVDLVSGGLGGAARRSARGAESAGRIAGRRRPAAALHDRARGERRAAPPEAGIGRGTGARERRGRGSPPRARASTHPDTPSSHPRLDPSPAAPPSWRHAGTSSGKRRGDRTAGGVRWRLLPRSCWASCALGPSTGGVDRPGAVGRIRRRAPRRRRPSIRSSDCCSPAPPARARTGRRCSTCGRQLRSRLGPDGRHRIRRDPAPDRRSRALGAVDRGGRPATWRSSTARRGQRGCGSRFHPGSAEPVQESQRALPGSPAPSSRSFVMRVSSPTRRMASSPGHAAGDIIAELDGGPTGGRPPATSGSGIRGHRRRERLPSTGGLRDRRRRSGVGRVRRAARARRRTRCHARTRRRTTAARRGARRTAPRRSSRGGSPPAPLSVSAADIADVESALSRATTRQTPDAALVKPTPSQSRRPPRPRSSCCSAQRVRPTPWLGGRRRYRAWIHRDDGPYKPVEGSTETSTSS